MTRLRLVHLTVAGAILLALAACAKTDSPTSPSAPPAAGSTVNYTAIGASDAIGYGSSAVCVPFAVSCPNGMGYVQVMARQLQSQGSTVNLVNLGIPGAVIGPRFNALAVQYSWAVPSNFVEGEVPFVPRNSTLVTVFAGGNDVNTVGAAIRGGAGGGDPWGYIDQQVKVFAAEYASLLAGIRERAPGARIVVANLPNYAAIPMTAGFPLEERQMIQKISVAFSTQVINPLAAQGTPVVDLLCNEQFSDPGIFSPDGFHPNDAGYAILAAEMLKAVMATSFPAPAATCRLMQVVPAR